MTCPIRMRSVVVVDRHASTCLNRRYDPMVCYEVRRLDTEMNIILTDEMIGRVKYKG